MIERIQAWQCIGCGRIEGAQPCVGICQDRKAEFVHASDHDVALAQARRQLEPLSALVRLIAHTSPRAGECERTWLALQQRARRVLDGLEDGGQPGTVATPAANTAPASGNGPRPAPRPRGTRR
jgi:hypothetical protein